MKEGAEKVELKIQAKVESLKNANDGEKGTPPFLTGFDRTFIFRSPLFFDWPFDTRKM